MLVGWADDNGVAKYTTFDSLKGSTSKHGSVLYGSVAKSGVLAADGVQGIANFRSGATIAVDEATVKALNTRYGRSENTGTSNLTDITVKKGASIDEVTSQLPKNVDLTYSDGSTGSLPISSWNTEGIDLTKVGDYTVTGTVKQTEYQIPFAEDRADPSVYKWQWTHEVDGKEVTETKFLMIASNDIQGDVTWQHGSPHMPFRMADTISGLADEPGNPNALIQSNGYNNKEVSLLKAGDKDSEGNAIMHSFWAPEIHEIDGRLTILFMAGYGNTWSNGKSVYMQLKQDADGHDLDPTDPDNWTVPTPIYRNDASLLNGNKQLAATASGGVGMSLDMTYFQDADGRSYYAWQQLGATYIATMDPKDPAHVTSSPVRIVTPEYAWNAAIAEGPNVTMRDGKLYLMFSGSGVGKTYTTGLAVADAAGSDLTDPASWTVLNYPIQKSGPFNGEMQLGTGHGMWSEDEDGNQIYVFHAYATKNLGSVNATGRAHVRTPRALGCRRYAGVRHELFRGAGLQDRFRDSEGGRRHGYGRQDRLVQGARVRQAAARVRLHRRLVEGVRRSVGLRREGLCRRERFAEGRRRRNRRVEQGAGRVGEGRRFRFGRWLERFD